MTGNATYLAFGAGLSLQADASCIHIVADEPLWTLSSALVGGGFGWRRHFCNFHVPRDYDSRTPASDLQAWLAECNAPQGESLAMMTAVHLKYLAIETLGSALVAVTAGVGNAVDITALLAGDLRPVGTINTLVFLDAHLTESAMVNACLSASEAKVRALQSLGVLDPHSGTPASGTSTDCLTIAATQRGEPTPYAGSATRLGRELGRAVYQATRAALQASGDWEGHEWQENENTHG